MDKSGRILLVISMGFLACQSITVEEIGGSWKADKVFDEGDSIAVDLSATTLLLETDQTFHYQLTSREHLQGTFEIAGDLLHLYCHDPKDTIRVQVLELSTEELLLRMNHQGIERKITLIRQAPPLSN